jgi:hypothetical protein
MIAVLAALSSLLLLGSISTMGISVFAAKFTSIMSGSNEVPPVNTNTTGYTSFRTATNDTVIKYKVNVTGISDATGAHIHIGKTGANGDIIVDLLKDSKKNPTKLGMVVRGNITGADLTGPMKGKTFAELISTMKNGDTYVNVHTQNHPSGEIRGQIDSGSRNTNANINQTVTVTVIDTGNLTQTG